MEQARKSLRTSSIIVLGLAGLTLLNIAYELLFGALNHAEIPAGSPDHTLLITKIILLVVSLVLILPRIYIGIKGLKVAKSPDSSKGHIVWGIIVLVFEVIGLITPLLSVIKGEAVGENVSELLSIAVNVTVFFEYVKYARIVSRGN